MKFSPRQREALTLVAEGNFYPCLVEEDDGWHARWRALGASSDLDVWVDAYVRSAALTRLTEDAEDQKHQTLHDAWMMALKSRTGLVRWETSECAAFADELVAWSGNAKEDSQARASVAFAFTADRDAFSLSCDVPKGRTRLKALGQAVYVYGPLRGLCRVPGTARLSIALTRAEAEDFVRRGARDLRNAGYPVVGADMAVPLTASLEIDADEATDAARAKLKRTDFHLTVRVAGEVVTADEVRFLLDQGSSLVYFRDHWIEVDRGILKEALRALEQGLGRKANLVSFAMGLGHVGRLELAEVQAHGWVRGLLHELRRRGEDVRSVTPATLPGFHGTLRDYQREGVAWISFMSEYGFGALLADDMGLGKTIQTIGWILSVPRDAPVLIVAPLTLLANWAHEFAKFAPALKIYVHQGSQRHFASGFGRIARASDVVLTSAALLVRDHAAFAGVAWSALVVDEAQIIKNPETQVAKAVCSLAPARRLALTGTPIENSVADIWSVEEFLNPGFLGERKAFVERFVRSIAADDNSLAAKRLKTALEPFVLRRLKTDPGIAAELGPKREVREYCELLPVERRAYEAVLADYRAMPREPGDAFTLLTRLKLVCDGESADESCKMQRLQDLVGEILTAGESALVFTQYAKVGSRIQASLEKFLARPVPFLYGGLGTGARDRLVQSFQRSREPGVFVLSLKAGGFGLNLTKASHVIHFDRWWNPAVENQATDRAHRIGQDKTVFVHLFITSGTIEERVDEILSRKESLKTLIADGPAFWRAAQLKSQE